ncbi:uncharacterized protein LOC142106869 [Mixophyes fleayi]|uniref:uncharacterized protein LOC142106869 n=1 Tax=Mixophyes fleayi TaxID=3061075 RepID=UPI003F4E0DEA
MNGCAAESFCRVKDILKSNSLKKETFMCTKPIVNTHVCRTSTEWKENKIDRYLCMPDEDVCLSEYTQSIYDNGTVISEHILRCGKSSECNLHITITHPKKTIGIRTTCCSTYDCIPPTVHASFVKVPQPEYNGLTCQACYSDGSINCVSNNTMVCTGTQDHCIIYTSEKKHSPDPYSKKYGNSVESLTGCGTKDCCIYGRSFVTFDHHGKTVNITCTMGSSNINFLSYLSWTFFALILLQYVNTLL